jgi:hypothetical protein
MNRIGYLITALAAWAIGFSIVSTGTGCAGMTPPTGGPRDSLPPVIVGITPKDSTLRFTGKKIVLNFNEYVQVQDVQKNLLVNPTPKVNPTVEAKLKTITITVRDTLKDNTTYVMDFGNAIQDINEGNPLRNYRYMFSTGAYLDSLKLAGRVIVAQTGKADSTLIVMLHTSLEDSAVVKEQPRYVARVDSTGRFQFNNLAPGTFAIYALKDEGGQRRYLSREQLFAFSDSSVTSQSERNDIQLFAYKAEDTTKEKGERVTPAAAPKKLSGLEEKYFKLQTNAGGGTLGLLSSLELTFPEPLRTFDSTKVVFADKDFKPITNFYYKRDTTNKKISLVYPWPESTTFNLIVDSTFAEDTLGRHLIRTDTLSFETKSTKEYGLLDLRFRNLPLEQHPILQFVQGDEIKYTHIFTNNRVYIQLFEPGEYELRIVFDTNKNGVWDTGRFFDKHLQPEKVKPVPRKLNVRANWDTEVDIEL